MTATGAVRAVIAPSATSKPVFFMRTSQVEAASCRHIWGTLRLSGKRMICTLLFNVTRNTRGVVGCQYSTSSTRRLPPSGQDGAVDIDSVAEELYWLPPEEFTAARNLQ